MHEAFGHGAKVTDAKVIRDKATGLGREECARASARDSMPRGPAADRRACVHAHKCARCRAETPFRVKPLLTPKTGRTSGYGFVEFPGCA